MIVFTAALTISDLRTPYDDIAQFAEYVELSEERGVPLVVVNIMCDLSTNGKRLCSEERNKVHGKTKLVDIAILERLRRETSMLDREQAVALGKDGSIIYFELDTSELTIEQAAQKVMEFLHKVTEQQASLV